MGLENIKAATGNRRYESNGPKKRAVVVGIEWTWYITSQCVFCVPSFALHCKHISGSLMWIHYYLQYNSLNSSLVSHSHIVLKNLSIISYTFGNRYIAVTSHELHGVSNHLQRDCFSTVCSGQQQRNIKAFHHHPFLCGIHPKPTNSSQRANNAESHSMSWHLHVISQIKDFLTVYDVNVLFSCVEIWVPIPRGWFTRRNVWLWRITICPETLNQHEKLLISTFSLVSR